MKLLDWATGSRRESGRAPEQPSKKAKPESRVHGRFKVKSPITLTWEDTDGRTKTLKARAIDMSTVGARIESSEPMSPGAYAYLKAPALNLMGSAVVRHCISKGFKYRIGLQFRSPLTRCY